MNDQQARTAADTEQRILQAAEHEFATKGFAGARTTSIAEAAGVTHAMLHYYFRTKEKLFNRIIAEKISLLAEVVSKSLENVDQSLEDQIRNLIDLHLDFLYANPDLPRLLISEVFNSPERLSIISRQIREVASGALSRLQQKIDRLADMGACRRVDARMLMLDLVSLNVFPFIATPLINIVLSDCMSDQAEFIKLRKKENYETIMSKLRP